MKKSILLVLFLSSLIVSCVSTTATMLGGAVRPETAQLQPEQIVIYRNAEQIGKPFREIAILNSSGSSVYTSMGQFYISMQTRAAEAGANAVIIGENHEPSTAAEIAAVFLGSPSTRKSEATAIWVEGLIPPPPKTKN